MAAPQTLTADGLPLCGTAGGQVGNIMAMVPVYSADGTFNPLLFRVFLFEVCHQRLSRQQQA